MRGKKPFVGKIIYCQNCLYSGEFASQVLILTSSKIRKKKLCKSWLLKIATLILQFVL